MYQTFLTPRLWLRPVARPDLPRLLDLDADPEVMRFISGGRPSSVTDYGGEDGLLERMSVYADRPFGYFMAFEREPEAPEPEPPEPASRSAASSRSLGRAGPKPDRGLEAQSRFCGWFHLRPSVFDASMLELGYRLRRDAWGRGLATEGSRALLAHAFEELDQRAVDACTVTENLGSIAVMMKCGMHFVGERAHPRAEIKVQRYLVERPRPVLTRLE